MVATEERISVLSAGEPTAVRGPNVAKKKAKSDACTKKVKSRYKVWPSAYASGALVRCRKVGAKNWGTGGKKKRKK